MAGEETSDREGPRVFELLKIVHFFCLLAGGAASIGNTVLMLQVERSGGPPPPMVPKAMGIIANMGLGAIILLWITGVAMVLIGIDRAALDWMFYVKLAGAATVLGLVIWMTVLRSRAVAAGLPPPMARMKLLSRIAFAGLSVAIIFAVLAFG